MGTHDDRRVLLFEEQQKAYLSLQSVLLGLGQPGWALGVAEHSKLGVAEHSKVPTLAHRLCGGSDAAEIDAYCRAAEGAYAEVCCACHGPGINPSC